MPPDPVVAKQVTKQVEYLPLGLLAVGNDGWSEWGFVEVPQHARYVAIRVTPDVADPTKQPCLRLEPVVTGTGRTLVETSTAQTGDRPTCDACSERVYSSQTYGLFVFPTGWEALPGPDSLRLRARFRDCLLQIPVSRARIPALAQELILEWAWEPALPEAQRGTLHVRLALAADVPLDDLPEVSRAQIRMIFDSAGIDVDFDVVTRLSVGGELDAAGPMQNSWFADAMTRLSAGPRDVRFAPVVLASCLSSAVGPTPLGFTSRIPGGISPTNGSSAVYVAAACGGQQSLGDLDLGTVVAHELGHYLGLYHSDEAEGARLAEPGAEIMRARPVGLPSDFLRFSAGQILAARRHPDLVFSR
ncbi:MAG: hypothetical protein HYV07_26065 [Deltaproteobacteria bacterium]|nr:hypothetical protein [Deltaproteobacteria bacterium]